MAASVRNLNKSAPNLPAKKKKNPHQIRRILLDFFCDTKRPFANIFTRKKKMSNEIPGPSLVVTSLQRDAQWRINGLILAAECTCTGQNYGDPDFFSPSSSRSALDNIRAFHECRALFLGKTTGLLK